MEHNDCVLINVRGQAEGPAASSFPTGPEEQVVRGRVCKGHFLIVTPGSLLCTFRVFTAQLAVIIEGSEAQRGKGTCPRPQAKTDLVLEINPTPRLGLLALSGGEWAQPGVLKPQPIPG